MRVSLHVRPLCVAVRSGVGVLVGVGEGDGEQLGVLDGVNDGVYVRMWVAACDVALTLRSDFLHPQKKGNWDGRRSKTVMCESAGKRRRALAMCHSTIARWASYLAYP